MTATVPPSQSGQLTTYSSGFVPLLEGGESAFVKRELETLRAVLEDVLIMTPQSATKAPPRLKDGMRRLSRNPWRPVSGQTADAWVYWDAAGQLWRYESTAPTTT